MLTMTGITAGYGQSVVLRDLAFQVGDGEVVALLGPNGAGKSTLLRTATGFVRARTGRIAVDGEDVTNAAPHHYVAQGVCHLPEGRGIFPSLTVRENVAIQARKADFAKCLSDVTDMFPILGKRLRQTAGSLSGGEQQMLALSRAFVTQPKLVVIDEPSLGLAPKIIDQIYGVLDTLVRRGMALVIVEQYVQRALDLADTVYILAGGRFVHRGDARSISPQEIYQHYLRIETS
jgi:branched-chain amino acid transport system ATP-binding protein